MTEPTYPNGWTTELICAAAVWSVGLGAVDERYTSQGVLDGWVVLRSPSGGLTEARVEGDSVIERRFGEKTYKLENIATLTFVDDRLLIKDWYGRAPYKVIDGDWVCLTA